MVNYENGVVYKLSCSTGHFYIGSTASPLRMRLSNHKGQAKLHPERRVYKHILENGGFSEVSIIEVEKFPCKTRQELQKREDEVIRQFLNDPLCLNIRKAFLNDGELQDHMKNYYETTLKERLEIGRMIDGGQAVDRDAKTIDSAVRHYESVKRAKHNYYLRNQEELKAKQRAIYRAKKEAEATAESAEAT